MVYGGNRPLNADPTPYKVPIFFTRTVLSLVQVMVSIRHQTQKPQHDNPVSYPETTGSHIQISTYHQLNDEHEYHAQHTNYGNFTVTNSTNKCFTYVQSSPEHNRCQAINDVSNKHSAKPICTRSDIKIPEMNLLYRKTGSVLLHKLC